MEEYKQEYNKLLKRYYNGCEYLKNNPNEFDFYFDGLLKILDKLVEIVGNHTEMTNEEILNGFEEKY